MGTVLTAPANLEAACWRAELNDDFALVVCTGGCHALNAAQRRKQPSVASRMRKKAVSLPLPHGRGSVNACKHASTFPNRARQQAGFGLFSMLLDRNRML